MIPLSGPAFIYSFFSAKGVYTRLKDSKKCVQLQHCHLHCCQMRVQSQLFITKCIRKQIQPNFDCCKQSLNQLQHPPTHPPIHPVPQFFCTKNERLSIYCLYLLPCCASCFDQISNSKYLRQIFLLIIFNKNSQHFLFHILFNC